MRFAKGDHALRKVAKIRLVLAEAIVQPVPDRIEVIRIVVALERSQVLIASRHHRRSRGYHQEGQTGARGAALVGRGAPLIPAIVIVAAAVRGTERPRLVVVPVVAGIQVFQCEPVMRHDEVHGIPRQATIVLVQVGRSRKARRQRRDGDRRHTQLVLCHAHRVAIMVIPFRPARRETADLVGVAADPPWFRDQIDPVAAGGRPRLELAHDAIECGVRIKLVKVEASDSGKCCPAPMPGRSDTRQRPWRRANRRANLMIRFCAVGL